MGLISRSDFSDSQVPTAAGFNLPFNTIYNEFNGNIDSNNIKAASISAANLQTSINPVTLRQELFLSPFIKTGLTIPTSASLSTTTVAGTAYINGQRLTVSATPRTYTASKDTYVYLKDDGTFTYSEVANNATAPTATTNSDGTAALCIAVVVSSGTAITSVNNANGWALYFPTLGGVTINNGTVIARYQQIGKTVHASLEVLWGSTTSQSGSFTFTLPVAASSRYTVSRHNMGQFNSWANSSTSYNPGFLLLTSATVVTPYQLRADGASLYVISGAAQFAPTSPATWATNDMFVADFTYEAA